jgi:hypothetical protein
VRGLVPVRAWFALPPVFVPTYPVNWVDVQALPEGVAVALWQRRLPVRRRLEAIEWLVARRPLPPAVAEPPRVMSMVLLAPGPAQPAPGRQAPAARAAERADRRHAR